MTDRPLDRNYWQAHLAAREAALGYSDGFKLLFCPWDRIGTARSLFLSLNPGNDPSGEHMRVASDERGNSYLVERQARHSPIAAQYVQLCQFLGRDAEAMLAGTLMPFRTPRWEPRRDRPNLGLARPFWRAVFETGRLREVFCMGRDAEREAVRLAGARLDMEIPANWGNLTIRRYSTAAGMRLYGLLHLSTYKMFGRPDCLPQLARLFDHGPGGSGLAAE